MSEGPIPVVLPPGELHDETLGGFERDVEPHLAAAGPGLVVDLSGVEFMSSTGLGYLVKVGMTLDRNQRRLALARGSRRLTRLLRVTGLGPLLPHFGSLDDARAFVAGEAPARR
jgi:anti-anti-sigma factor